MLLLIPRRRHHTLRHERHTRYRPRLHVNTGRHHTTVS